MTKITKSDLKAIVKECLVEILSEGLGGTSFSSAPTITQRLPNRSENSFLEEKRLRDSSRVRQQPQLQEFIKKESGGNKIMEDIFADTAASTLPKMMQSEKKGSVPVKHTLEEQIVASASPEDIFGEEAASKWAEYAFANITKK